MTTARQPARQVLLAVDEFSAVSRRLPIWQLFERARSLGLSVQVSAQSWHGLAASEDDRYRLAATAEGGIWLLRTPYPEPVVALAGQQTAVDTTRQLTGWLRWSRAGSSRLRQIPVADPELVRGLDTGQAAYLYRGGVTFTQVKRLVAGPAALPAEPARTTRPAEPARTTRPAEPAGPSSVPLAAAARAAAPALPPQAARTTLPDVTEFLDEVFGSLP